MSMDLDLVRRFLAQLRQAFMQAVPRPVFQIEMDRIGHYRVVGVARVEFEEKPIITCPAPFTEALMDLEFQKMVNRALRRRPAVLAGKADVGFRGKLIAQNIAWRGTVSRIKLMVQENGCIRIDDFE